MLRHKYKSYIVNDISDSTHIFYEAINGDYEGLVTVLSKDEFLNTDDDALKITHSFGYNRRDYLWKEDIAKIKVPISKILLSPDVHSRRINYMHFIDSLDEYLEQGKDVSKLRRVVNLEGLERIQSLKALDASNLEWFQMDYRGLQERK